MLTLGLAALTEEVTVTAQTSEVFSSARTGAATTVNREALQTLPTVRDRINDFARLSPQYTGGAFGGSFVGQDNRLNNITIDGSYFNNSFGLGGQPGDRTGVTPVSSAAIEEIQVNVAPYDVRQGNFVGAGVNMITRSGGNQFRGSAYYWFRDNDLVGTEAKGLTYNPGTFDSRRFGAWASGPDHQGQALLLRQHRGRQADLAGHDVPRQHRRRDGGRQRHARARLRPRPAELVPELQLQVRHRPLPGLRLRDPGPALPGQARLQPERPQQDQRALHAARLEDRPAGLGLLLARLRQPPHAHDRPQLRELELQDPREHQVRRRRVELDHRHQQGQLADRGLHLPGREPRVGRRVLPDGGHPQRGHDLHHVRLRAVHARTTSCGTRPSRSRTASPGTAATTRSRSAPPRSATSRRTSSSPARRASTPTTRSPTSTPTRTTTWPTRTARPRR